MTGFLMNMINRHQDRVDKVQPRIRSMFEPEQAPDVAVNNAFADTENAMVKESRSSGYEQQSAFPKSPGLDKSIPENPPSAPQSVMFQQPAQTGEGFRSADRHPIDKNRMDLTNEYIQSMLVRLGRKSESPETFNDPNGLQKSVPFEATGQTTGKVVSNEMGLTNRIEETLGRLKNHTDNTVEGNRGFQDQAQILPAFTVNTEADPLLTLPAHPEIKGDQSARPHTKSTNHPVQTVNTPINSRDGAFQIPFWLSGMQTELNNRWREINAKPHAEPVINVTIGRVEVRAINTETVKPSAVQGKPKGVLSLDDYLKQRESKGRT
jgi:hypothetical protein